MKNASYSESPEQNPTKLRSGNQKSEEAFETRD